MVPQRALTQNGLFRDERFDTLHRANKLVAIPTGSLVSAPEKEHLNRALEQKRSRSVLADRTTAAGGSILPLPGDRA
jgi:hypothetical protein